MNRYLLTARSLVTDSKLVLFAHAAFAIVALACLFFGQILPVIIWFACVLLGLGFMTRRFFESERRKLVPGMNEACVQVSVSLLFLLWAISCLLIVGFEGFVPEMIGGCLLGFAFALWFGTLDPIAAMLVFPIYTVPLFAISSRETVDRIYKNYQALPPEIHGAVGLAMSVLALAVMARFWFVVTSKHSTLVQKPSAEKPRANVSTVVLACVAAFLVFQLARSPVVRQRSTVEWFNSFWQTGSHVLFAFAIGSLLFAFWRSLTWWFFPRRLSVTAITPIVMHQVSHNYWKMVPWSLLVVFVVCLGATDLFSGWEGDESINARIGFIMFFTPFITATTLLYGMPKVFERFWIMGSSENRAQTARVMLLLVVSQSIFLNVIALVCVVSIAMSTSMGYAPTLILGTLVIGFGAILFWVFARWHPFWLQHVSLAVCLVIGGVGSATVIAISNADNVLHRVAELSSSYGAVPTIAMAVLTTTGLWFFAVWDSARCMGSSSQFMECKNGLNDFVAHSSVI